MAGKKKGSARGNIEEAVGRIAEPVAEKLGLDIWDIVYEKVGGNAFLRIFIDRFEGVTIEDCENFSRTIDPLLDEADPISDSYCLEVSSPGMGRTLSKQHHFDAVMGEEIMLTLYSPFEGNREITGLLKSYNDGEITLSFGDDELTFTKSQVAKVRLYDDELYK